MSTTGKYSEAENACVGGYLRVGGCREREWQQMVGSLFLR